MSRKLVARTRSLNFQTLEARDVPVSHIGFAGGVYTISNNVAPVVQETFTLTRITGNSYRIELANDTFDAASVSADVTLDATSKIATLSNASGRSPLFNFSNLGDTLVVGTGSLDPFSSATTITVRGGTGADVIRVNDADDTNNNTYVLDSVNASDQSLARTNGSDVTVEYSGVETVSLAGGKGNDTVNVVALHAGTTAAVGGGDGDDTVEVATGNSLGTILGTLAVNGGAQDTAAGDQLIVQDDAATGPFTYVVDAAGVKRGAAVPIAYSNLEGVTLNASDGADTINIPATLAATPVTVNGGDGLDQFTVGNGTLDDVLGVVSLAGGNGNDGLTVKDEADQDAHTYTVNTTQVSRSGAAAVRFSSLSSLTVNAGEKDDTISVAATASATPLTVDGGKGDDAISVGGGLLANLVVVPTLIPGEGSDTLTLDDSANNSPRTFNISAATIADGGRTYPYAADGFEKAVVLAGDDTDTINVNGTSVPTTVNGGTGTDTVNVAEFDALAGSLNVVGGVSGTDRLNVNDGAGVTNTAYHATASAVTRDADLRSVGYQGFEVVVLDAAPGTNAVVVGGTAVGSTLTLNTGAGADTITVGNTTLAGLNGTLVLNAGGGAGDANDLLIVDDSGTAAGQAYEVTATAITRALTAVVTFGAGSGVDSVLLNTGAGNDTVSVSATTLPTTVNGGLGADGFTVGPMGAIAGLLEVNGDANTDTLTFDDSNASADGVYTVTSAQVQRASAGTVNYTTAEELLLNTGGGADTVGVASTGVSTTWTVETANGDDTITVGAGGTLSGIAGDLTVDAGSATGRNVLILTDESFATPTGYTVAAAQVARGTVAVGYAGEKIDLTLRTGTGNNTVRVAGTPTDSRATINGGAGDDTVTLGDGALHTLAGIRGTLAIAAGGPINRLVVDDVGNTAATTYLVTPASLSRTGLSLPVTYSGFSRIVLDAGTASDTVTVEPSTGTAYTLDGGTAVGSLDTLRFQLPPNAPPPSGLTSPITIGSNLPIAFDHFEVVGIETPEITLIGGDRLTIRGTAANAGTYTLDGASVPFFGTTKFLWTAQAGDNVLTVDNSVALFTPSAGIQFNAGAGTHDRLEVLNGTALDGTFAVGPAADRVQITHRVAAGTQTITATGLDADPLANAVTDTVAEPTFRVTGTAADDTINVLAGSVNFDTATGSPFVPVGYDNKGRVQVLAGDGADTICVDLTTADPGPPVPALVEVSGDGGADSIAVLAVPADRDVSVDGGLADDTLVVGKDGRLDLILGALDVAGGGGLDAVSFEDHLADAADAYTITAAAVSWANGGATPVVVPYAAAEVLVLKTSAGDDTVGVASTLAGTPVTVDTGTGAGDDTVTVGTGTLDNILGAVSVAGGGGADVLIVADEADNDVANTYTIEPGQVTRSVAVSYSGVRTLAVNAGRKNDTINVPATAGGTDITIDAGEGNDTVGAGVGTLDDLLGPITLQGGLGDDLLAVDESANAGGDTYEVSAASVARTTAGAERAVSYGGNGFERVRLDAGGGVDAVNVLATTLPITVTGGAGKDAIVIGSALNSLGDIAATVSVLGGGGGDELTVNDDGASAGFVYTLTGTSIDRAGATVVAYADVDAVALNTSAGADDVTVTSTAASIRTTVNAGAGADTVRVNATAGPLVVVGGLGDDVTVGNGTLDNIRGAVNVLGGVRLAVDDSADPDASAYTLTGTTLDRTGAATITFSGLAALELATGTGNDTVAVDDTPAAVPVTIRTGAGADAVTLSRTQDTVSVSGGAGDDTVTVGNSTLDSILGDLALDAGTGASDRLVIDDSGAAVGHDYEVTATTVDRTTGTDRHIDYGTAGFDALLLLSGTGADLIEVFGTASGTPVEINGGTGADRVVVGNPTLDNILSPVSVAGGAGDRLEIIDSGDDTNNDYTLTATALTRAATLTPVGGAVTVNFSGVGTLLLTTGDGSDSVGVSDTPAGGGPVTVQTGAGNDAITLTRIGGPVSLDGGAGNDTITAGVGTLDNLIGTVGVSGGPAADVDWLVVNDAADVSDNAYTIDAGRVVRTAGGTATVNYSGIDRLRVTAGIGRDTLDIPALDANVSATVNAGAGNDAVTVGDGSLDGVAGTLVFDAGLGGDTLTVNDSADDDANAYQVTRDEVGRTSTPDRVYLYAAAGFERVNLLAGSGADTVAVLSTASGIPVSVAAGAGADSLTVGSDVNSLDDLLGDITLAGGGGSDRLTINDQGDAGGNTYNLAAGTFDRTGTAQLTYQTVEALVVNASGGADTVNVSGTAAGTPVTVNGGAGNDAVNVSGTDALGPVRVDGGADNDTVNVGAGNLDAIRGAVTPIDTGGAGDTDNRLIIDDSASLASHTYALLPLTPTAPGQVVRTGGPTVPYAVAFHSVALRGGAGADTVTGDTGSIRPVEVDGGAGNDTFDLTYLSGQLRGGGGTGDTLVGKSLNPMFEITGANAGAAAGLVGGGFVDVENLTGGPRTDRFVFRTGGSLSGTVKGEGAIAQEPGYGDLLMGDDVGRAFALTGPGTGTVSVLAPGAGPVPGFVGIESVFGGAGADRVVFGGGGGVSLLTLFHGQGGSDSADFTARTAAQTIKVTGYSDPIAPAAGHVGFNITDVGAGSPSVANGIQGIDAVEVTGTATDTLMDGTTAGATWVVASGAGASYLVRPGVTDAANRLGFTGFERFQGGTGGDTFRVRAGAATTNLFFQGGVAQRPDDRNTLQALGSDLNDTISLLPRTLTWPAQAGSFNGLRFNDLPRLLYDGIHALDLRGEGGNDTFVINPLTAGGPLYGKDVRELILQGGTGDDTFEVVPDKFNNKPATSTKADPRVNMRVFGGTVDFTYAQGESWKAGVTTDKDVMILYQLPVRIKANFPIRGAGGTPSNNFELTKKGLNYGSVKYYDLYTVVATTDSTTARVKGLFPLAGA